jgi:hypothetical protein
MFVSLQWIPALGQRVLQNYIPSVFVDDQTAREKSVFNDAASISKKLENALDSVRLPACWKYIGPPDNAYQCTVSKVLQKERPFVTTIGLRQVYGIFACFEAEVIARLETLPHHTRSYITQEIKNSAKILSCMTKTIIFTNEPAIFFNHNWHVILLIRDKLTQVS